LLTVHCSKAVVRVGINTNTETEPFWRRGCFLTLELAVGWRGRVKVARAERCTRFLSWFSVRTC
jgi:hypothetical protein